MKCDPGNFSRYCLLPLWQQKYHDQHKYGGYSYVSSPTPQPMIKQKERLSLSSLSKVALEIKPKCSKNLDSPSLLFFPSSETSQEKVFSKVGVSKFFVEILEKH